MSEMRNGEGPFSTHQRDRSRRAYRTFRYVTDDYGNAVLLRWCSGPCNKWKTADQFSNIDKKTGRPKGLCRECKPAYDRAYRAANKKKVRANERAWRARQLADPVLREILLETERRAQRRRREADKERANRWAREWYERTKNDPERHARLLETRRIAARLRREKNGAPLVPERRPKVLYSVKNEQVLLDPGPMQEWVQKKLSKYGGPAELALACGTDENRIRDIRDGKLSAITRAKVERFLVAEGSTELWELYPDELSAA